MCGVNPGLCSRPGPSSSCKKIQKTQKPLRTIQLWRYGPGSVNVLERFLLPSPVRVGPSFASHAGDVSRCTLSESGQSRGTGQTENEISADPREVCLQASSRGGRPAGRLPCPACPLALRLIGAVCSRAWFPRVECLALPTRALLWAPRNSSLSLASAPSMAPCCRSAKGSARRGWGRAHSPLRSVLPRPAPPASSHDTHHPVLPSASAASRPATFHSL